MSNPEGKPKRKATRVGVADAHRDDGRRFIVRADEELTAFVELEAAIRDWAARSKNTIDLQGDA